MQVRKKDTQRIYALKTIRKAHIAQRPGEITHILAERTVLALVNNPFIVPLKFSFQTPDKLYLGMSFSELFVKGYYNWFLSWPSQWRGIVLSSAT
jgi:serum/glucocorticoid-regulated kinase 2